jgi:hypothetical protein
MGYEKLLLYFNPVANCSSLEGKKSWSIHGNGIPILNELFKDN